MIIQIQKFEDLDGSTLYQILKLRVDVFVVEQNCAYPELDNKDQEAIHFFVRSDKGIKTYLRVYHQSPERIVIGRVITGISFRNKGLSRLMMESAMTWVNDGSNAKLIYLQAQEHLTSFYESFGFKPTSAMYLEDGIPHVDMEYQLPRS